MMRKDHVRFGGGPTEKGPQDHLAGGLPNYGGSGPAQLALAILSDAIGPENAQAGGYYQQFKFGVIARLAGDRWELSREDVLRWCRENPPPRGEAA